MGSLFGSDTESEGEDQARVVDPNDDDGPPRTLHDPRSSQDAPLHPEKATADKHSNDTGGPHPARHSVMVASCSAPPIHGLHLFRGIVTLSMQEVLLKALLETRSVTLQHPQAMIFPKHGALDKNGRPVEDLDNCPDILRPLVECLPDLLRDLLSDDDWKIVFDESLPLQTILNLYEPGQGITPHVDLPHRYGHPIVGISLAGSTVMDFFPLEGEERQGSDDPACEQGHSILLEPGDLYVLLHDARYRYKHGIAYRSTDIYEQEDGSLRENHRGTRISITFRRMLPDAGLLTDA